VEEVASAPTEGYAKTRDGWRARTKEEMQKKAFMMESYKSEGRTKV
jgi:hypothetical protein